MGSGCRSCAKGRPDSRLWRPRTGNYLWIVADLRLRYRLGKADERLPESIPSASISEERGFSLRKAAWAERHSRAMIAHGRGGGRPEEDRTVPDRAMSGRLRDDASLRRESISGFPFLRHLRISWGDRGRNSSVPGSRFREVRASRASRGGPEAAPCARSSPKNWSSAKFSFRLCLSLIANPSRA